MEAQKLIFLTGVNSSLNGNPTAPNSFGAFLLQRDLLSLTPDSSIEKLVCIDYSPSVASEIKKFGLGPEDCTLVRMEPSVVLPANFAKSRQKQFKQIITVGAQNSSGAISVYWPLVWPTVHELAQSRDTNRAERVVLINGNKMSFVKGELYSLRRKAIKAIVNLDLYGTQWDSKLAARLITALRSFAHAIFSLKWPRSSGIHLWFQGYQDYKGPVGDKLATMSKYKYALVIENSAEYMSEKLMEALFAGCLPIYVGPDPRDYGIPKELVVWVDPTIESIQEGLREASTLNFNHFSSGLSAFLGSNKVQELWGHSQVHTRILEEIQKKNRPI